MTRADGMISISVPTARICQATRHPKISIAQVASGVNSTPAKETPIAASATARPLNSTNHFDKVTLTTKLPTIAAPRVRMTPLSRIQCHNSLICESRKRASPRIKVPAIIKPRGPL